MAEKYTPGTHPDLPPPKNLVGPAAWIRDNLFSGPVNSIMTVFCLYLLWVIVPPLVNWLFLNAEWIWASRDGCSLEGA